MKPNEIKEAKQYVLEQRIINEENERLNDIVILKDILGKLIYSFQTSDLLIPSKNSKKLKGKGGVTKDVSSFNQMNLADYHWNEFYD